MEMEGEVSDYLTKQISIERNVVTFRSLSRHFNIHVNLAKKMDVDVDMGLEEPDDDSELVPLTKITLVGEQDLKNQNHLSRREITVLSYTLGPRVQLVSVAFGYWLMSHTRPRHQDAGLICSSLGKAYEAEAKMSAESSALLGRIIGPHVVCPQRGKPMPLAASTSKVPAAGIQEQTVMTQKSSKPIEVEKDTKKSKEEKPALKPRASVTSGTLDWSKAKEKQADGGHKVQKVAPAQADTKAKKEMPAVRNVKSHLVPQNELSRSAPTEDTGTAKPETKRGVKRKSTSPDMSDSEGEQSARKPVLTDGKPTKTSIVPPRLVKGGPKGARRRLLSESGDEERPLPASTSARGKVKAKKGVVLSDDEEDESEPVVRPPKGRVPAKSAARSRSPQTDKSLRAMMDIDDSEVIKASRTSPESQQEIEEPEPKADDPEIVDDSETERVKAKPRKRKEKKIVPVGQNGLKKKRIMKTRMRTDEKGYMVTEDYSEYESVDEEVPEEDEKKPRGKKTSTAKTKQVIEPKPKLKPSTSTSGTSRGNLRNFFGNTAASKDGSATKTKKSQR
ncbi:predicted protein [Postia placenta Mad-698-R]|nr:predicted protein [Postia placenta Mad-698-R]